ncbi:hypothetical protein F4806DRAFT_187862 [Annulohypoxylon nitens]|nr:hypothetical protein F4806DRAFT_187862 [Annulohypoxylon nitens]
MTFASTLRELLPILSELFSLLLKLHPLLIELLPFLIELFRIFTKFAKSISTRFPYFSMSYTDLTSHVQILPFAQRQGLIQVARASDSDETYDSTDTPATEDEQDKHGKAAGPKSLSNNQRYLNFNVAAVTNVNMHSFISTRSRNPQCKSYGAKISTGNPPGTTLFIVGIAIVVGGACAAIAGFGFGYAVLYLLP